MNIIKQYLFWRKWKDKLDNDCFKNGMSEAIYGITPNSFKITRENWKKMGVIK